MSSVHREFCEQKCKEIQGKQNSNNATQSRSYSKTVIEVLCEGEATTDNRPFYRYAKRYELLHSVGNLPSDSVVYIIAMKDYYSKSMEAHDEIGHGGHDKKLAFIKKKWGILWSEVEIFPNLCEACLCKRSDPKKGVVVKPILSYGFNSRGQVDLIAFQSRSSQEGYKFSINYQDHATKFLFASSEEYRSKICRGRNFFLPSVLLWFYKATTGVNL